MVETFDQLFFGVPIIRRTLPGFSPRQQQLIDAVRTEQQRDPEGKQRSNHQGWHSGDLREAPGEAFAWLKAELRSLASEVTAKRFKDGFRLELTSLWANVNPSGGFNAAHNHVPETWSGAFYVLAQGAAASLKKNPRERAGVIELFNPSAVGEEVGVPNSVLFSPVDGMALLFPGYLLHMVHPHASPHERISIAYNFRVLPP